MVSVEFTYKQTALDEHLGVDDVHELLFSVRKFALNVDQLPVFAIDLLH